MRQTYYFKAATGAPCAFSCHRLVKRSWSKPERSVRGASASQGLGEGRADSHTDPGKAMAEEETRCRRRTPQ